MPGDTSERQGTETKASGKLEGFLGGHHEDKLTRDSGPETFACAGSCQRCQRCIICANINPALC